MIDRDIATIYSDYTSDETGQLNPPVNEMVKIGLWLELEIGIGFMVGLGLGSLIGQRTVSTVLMIVLEIIITPILAAHVIPYFINGQRLVVGVAMDQLRPAGLAGGGAGGPGHVLFGGRGALGIPPMPTWAMITVIVGWIVGWSVIGAGGWRPATPDNRWPQPQRALGVCVRGLAVVSVVGGLALVGGPANRTAGPVRRRRRRGRRGAGRAGRARSPCTGPGRRCASPPRAAP